MPRETIHHPEGNPGDWRQPFDLEVGWTQGQYVDVRIASREAADGRHHLVDVLYGEAPTLDAIGRAMVNLLSDHDDDQRMVKALAGFREAPTSDAQADAAVDLGRVVLDVVTGSSALVASDSLTWSPSRQQVNALIRLLRKARDSAFGSDA